MRPIAGLTRAAREVARTRDPDITLPKPRANDEVSDLANTLRGHARASWAPPAPRPRRRSTRQRDFVADASHELRTPLTSILANLELLEAELDGEQREMAELRAALLAADAPAGRPTCCCSPAPTPAARPPRVPLDLARDRARGGRARPARSAAGPLRCRSTCPAPVPVTGVADDLHRLAGNLSRTP